MYIITKEFNFSAGHFLCDLRPGHPCGRFHGHNYKVIVELRSTKLENGFVRDYGDLKPIKDFIDNNLDHRHLNDILEQPTAEQIARFLFDRFKNEFPELNSVTVKETDKTTAKYEPGYD